MRRIRFKYKLKHNRERRRRLNILLACGILLFITAIVCSWPRDELKDYKQTDYAPAQGETLWSLAEKYYDGDPREWINAVKDLNAGAARIYAGQTITILIKGD